MTLEVVGAVADIATGIGGVGAELAAVHGVVGRRAEA